ncbi:hypothetical protein EON64_04060 [archaeon]|nr:MAG: hypothetical protein EON64_04060 [archaeon]
MTIIRDELVVVPTIEPNSVYRFPEQLEGIRLNVQWTSKQQGIICDLDLNAFMYDERVSYMNKL